MTILLLYQMPTYLFGLDTIFLPAPILFITILGLQRFTWPLIAHLTYNGTTNEVSFGNLERTRFTVLIGTHMIRLYILRFTILENRNTAVKYINDLPLGASLNDTIKNSVLLPSLSVIWIISPSNADVISRAELHIQSSEFVLRGLFY